MAFFFCFLLFSLIWIFSNQEQGGEKSNSFESGFDSKSMSISFSNQYYLIAILFLMFDLEIVLTFPIPFSLPKSSYLGTLFFLTFLIILFLEWKFGLLEWVK
uniref:NADH-ubiquinone oxidoreductase chain 3 n=1 Tax=Leptotrombidium pallidum TaxID=279272 RepID=Q4W8D3_9ACAR|nr:NADH dehydrogenase subunit 3 [Leptotrombidium pallidum]BAD99506.1 NADH dehydrogenase subunit 3 [Leptotrombidium pallidum]